MSTPENDPQTPAGDPNVPQYGQRAPLDPNAAVQPPYGQNPNPYGQPGTNNPYGQQPPQAQPPYGQQPYPGGFPVPQQGGFNAPQMPTHRPKELGTAFWAILAAGVVMMGYMLVGLSEASIRQQLTDTPDMQQLLDQANLSMNQMVTYTRVTAIIMAVIGMAIYVLIAFMVRKGSNVARIFATILAVLSLFFITGGLVMTLSVILGIVGVVFAWLRPSSQYITARRAARAAGIR